jgi:hypothetical protein
MVMAGMTFSAVAPASSSVYRVRTTIERHGHWDHLSTAGSAVDSFALTDGGRLPSACA